MRAAARPAILISGFYGFGNIGDEAVLAGTVQSLRARLASIPLVVLSADPAATATAYGVEAVGRTDLPAILAAMRRARLFLSGGGSLLQDVTSTRSAIYYLGLLRLAQIMGLRTMVYAAGLGPLRRPVVRSLVRRVVDRTDAVTVRDADSAALVRALGSRREPILTADPAVLLSPAAAAPAESTLRLAGAETPIIGVVVRPWGEGAYLRPLGEALSSVAARLKARVVVLPFYPALDLSISRWIAEASGGAVIEEPLQPGEALALIGRMHVLVALRLHALLFAAAAGVPPVGLAYDPKVTALHRDLEIGDPLPLGADAGAMMGAIRRAWEQREGLRPTLLAGTARLRVRAEVAVEEAARLYTAV